MSVTETNVQYLSDGRPDGTSFYQPSQQTAQGITLTATSTAGTATSGGYGCSSAAIFNALAADVVAIKQILRNAGFCING